MTAAEFAEVVNGRKVGAGKWSARCPAHGDKTPSLSITEGKDGRVLVNCFAGCTLTSILKSLGLQLRDLFSKVEAPERIRAAVARRQNAEHQARRQRQEERARAATARRFGAVADELFMRAACDSSTAGDNMAQLAHKALERGRKIECEGVEL